MLPAHDVLAFVLRSSFRRHVTKIQLITGGQGIDLAGLREGGREAVLDYVRAGWLRLELSHEELLMLIKPAVLLSEPTWPETGL
jgi:hypothetical protein